MLEEITTKLKNVTLSGANLGNRQNVSFQSIAKSGEFDLTPEQRKILSNWERIYLRLFERLKNNEFPINPIPIEDGRVSIDVGHPFHRASASISTLKGISVAGLVASEWYGILESEDEAYFCTFLNKVQEEVPDIDNSELSIDEQRKYLRRQSAAKKNRNTAFCHSPCIKNIALFFDGNNPVMKFLMRLDFFEYLKIRKEHPEKIEQIYDKRVIDLFEKVCDAQNMSFSAKFHDENDYDRKTWLAIPMGVPPMLVNGICINTVANPELIERIDEIAEMFPNAVIFNENKEVLRYPLVNEEQPKSL